MHGHVRVTLVDDGVHPQENRTARDQVGRPAAEVSGQKSGFMTLGHTAGLAVRCQDETFSLVSCPLCLSCRRSSVLWRTPTLSAG